jgi:hypothetical protein
MVLGRPVASWRARCRLTAVDLLQSQVTQDEAVEALKGWILSAPSPPEQVTLETPGTPENAFLYGLALAEENRSADRANYALAGFRSTAPIEWLRLIAIDFFGLPVQVAGYATATMSVTNTSGNSYGPFEVGELRVVNDATKAIYENTEVVTIQPAQLSPHVDWTGTFGVRAVDAGTASNSEVGDIDRLESAKEGVSVENTTAAITNDDESADSINRRTDARIGLFGVAGADGLSSGGPSTAVESIALSGRDGGGGVLRADGSRVQVTRTKLVRDDATGISTLYVGDNDGPLEASDLTLVSAEVVWYGERVCSQVVAANVVLVSITVNAAMTIRRTSLTNAQIEAAVEAAFPGAGLDVPIGGFSVSPDDAVPVEYIEGAIRGAAAGQWQIVEIEVTLPAADVLTAANVVVQFVLGTLTITRIS